MADTGSMRLAEMLAPVVESMGFEFWGLELRGGGKDKRLQLYIDSPDGITVDHCAAVSHQVSGILDVEDPIPGEYRLEVSSPGLDRPLFTLEQYKAHLGSQVQLRLSMPFEGRRNFTGRLNGLEQDDVVVQVDNEEYLLPFSQIERARIVPAFK